jgi:hypothetical protein
MKNHKIIATVFFATFLPCILVSQDKGIFQCDKLIKKWETAKTLKTPESVCYDPSSGDLYVSNINGKPADKDGNGFISLLTIDGKINELEWVTGLDAPKGMGIFNGILYVTDIDRVAAIDIKNKSIKKFYEFPEAIFLNDIAIDINGAVYISDMSGNKIYRIFEDNAGPWLEDPGIKGPNGLFVENDMLMIGCNKIVLAGIRDKKIYPFLEKTGGIDGLEGTGNGQYLFSDWMGHVYLTDADKKIETILDTTPDGINAADIEFIPEKKLLLVPTFGDNRVMAYELNIKN